MQLSSIGDPLNFRTNVQPDHPSQRRLLHYTNIPRHTPTILRHLYKSFKPLYYLQLLDVGSIRNLDCG